MGICTHAHHAQVKGKKQTNKQKPGLGAKRQRAGLAWVRACGYTQTANKPNFKVGKGHQQAFLLQNQPATDMDSGEKASQSCEMLCPTHRTSVTRKAASTKYCQEHGSTFFYYCGASRIQPLGKTKNKKTKKQSGLPLKGSMGTYQVIQKSTPRYISAEIEIQPHRNPQPKHTGQHSPWPHNETTQCPPTDEHVSRLYACQVQPQG